jgi:hypothetical protein
LRELKQTRVPHICLPLANVGLHNVGSVIDIGCAAAWNPHPSRRREPKEVTAFGKIKDGVIVIRRRPVYDPALK